MLLVVFSVSFAKRQQYQRNYPQEFINAGSREGEGGASCPGPRSIDAHHCWSNSRFVPNLPASLLSSSYEQPRAELMTGLLSSLIPSMHRQGGQRPMHATTPGSHRGPDTCRMIHSTFAYRLCMHSLPCRSLERALDRRLYLVVKNKGQAAWWFPEKLYEAEATMRHVSSHATFVEHIFYRTSPPFPPLPFCAFGPCVLSVCRESVRWAAP